MYSLSRGAPPRGRVGLVLLEEEHPREARVLDAARGVALEGADALAVITEWNLFRSPDFDHLRSTLRAPDLRQMFLRTDVGL